MISSFGGWEVTVEDLASSLSAHPVTEPELFEIWRKNSAIKSCYRTLSNLRPGKRGRKQVNWQDPRAQISAAIFTSCSHISLLFASSVTFGCWCQASFIMSSVPRLWAIYMLTASGPLLMKFANSRKETRLQVTQPVTRLSVELLMWLEILLI